MVRTTQRLGLFHRGKKVNSEAVTVLESMVEQDPRPKQEPMTKNPESGDPQAGRVRDIPVVESHYLPVWQRARAKLKSRFFLQRLGKEIQLFGANTIALQQSNIDSTTVNDIMRRKLQGVDHVKEDDHSSKGWFLFLPASPFKSIWGSIYLVLMLHTAFTMPFIMAFMDIDGDRVWTYLEPTIDGLFFFDILVTFNSAFYNAAGELVTGRKSIVLAYLKGWFILDLAACIPFYAFQSNSQGDVSDESSASQYKSFLRLGRLPRLYRLLRLTRIFKFIKHYRNHQCIEKVMESVCGKGSVIRLIAFFFMVSICVHLMSCLWYFVARLEGLGPQTWVVQRGLRDSSITDLYIASLFWTITTLSTVGYGDIVPGTSVERVLAIAWMLFGVCFFSFTIGSLATMLNSIDTKETVLTNKLAAIDEFASEAKLDKSLRYRLRHALRYSIEQTGFSSSDKRSIFNELPRQLKFEVAMAMHRGAAKSIPFFSERDQVFVASIVPFLNSQFVQESHTVFREKEYADEIYFIVEGRCVVMVNEKHVIKKLQRGSYFGEIEVIQQIPRKFTVSAATDVELLSMNKRILFVIKTDFPSVYEEMKEVAATRNHLNEKAKEQFLHLLALYKAGKLNPDEESLLQNMRAEGQLTKKFSEAGKAETGKEAEVPVIKVSAGEERKSICAVTPEIEAQVRSLDQRVQQMETAIRSTKAIATNIFSALTRNSRRMPILGSPHFPQLQESEKDSPTFPASERVADKEAESPVSLNSEESDDSNQSRLKAEEPVPQPKSVRGVVRQQYLGEVTSPLLEPPSPLRHSPQPNGFRRTEGTELRIPHSQSDHLP